MESKIFNFLDIFQLYNKPDKSRYLVEIENLTDKKITLQSRETVDGIIGQLCLAPHERKKLLKTDENYALVISIGEGKYNII